MKLALKAFALSLCFVYLAGYVHAKPQDPSSAVKVSTNQKEGETKPMKPFCMAHINLSDDQLEKLHAIREEHADKTMPKMVEMAGLKRKQMDLISQVGYDKQAVLDLQSKLTTLQTEISNDHLAQLLESDAVLTADQKKEMRRHLLRHEPPAPMGREFMGAPAPMGPPGMGPMGLDFMGPPPGSPRQLCPPGRPPFPAFLPPSQGMPQPTAMLPDGPSGAMGIKTEPDKEQ